MLNKLKTIFRVKNRHNELSQQSNLDDASDKGEVDHQAELIDGLSEKLLDVEIQLQAARLQGKHVSAQNIVKTHMVAGSSLALLPVPLFDIVVLAGTQMNLLRALSLHHEVDFDEQKSKVLLASLLSASLPVIAVLGLSSATKVVPGIGSVGGGISMSVLTSALIYSTGQVFISHFEQGGTLKNFKVSDWKSHFLDRLKEKKESLRRKDVNLSHSGGV
ncbi:DUF697 domain-containing protein [Leucothrix arctica]|uniref:GTPase n=1 Tax=Leucothrix arctica TaxID=1481894 RepID=A0A317CF05_9GAMM|nr:DUF697 domain-containing protein [Leucothrix arctica]PWQ97158.1 hypothetical protein DKT75_07535 [Leucothrix arctica]